MRKEKHPSFSRLAEQVEDWADAKGILDTATLLTQSNKLIEEATETKIAAEELFPSLRLSYDQIITKYGSLLEYSKACAPLKAQFIDGMGDTLVVLIILAKLLDLESNEPSFRKAGEVLLDALQQAYNTIKGRTGRMQDGMFVKD